LSACQQTYLQSLTTLRILAKWLLLLLLVVVVLAGEADADKQRLLQQLALLDASYHGGLAAYINNAKQLLTDSKEGEQSNLTPTVP
jgi:hypothetical protein